MDPGRKRTIRATIALTVALLLASALVYTSFAAGHAELTAAQLVTRAQPGQSYVLAGTVLAGSVQRAGGVLSFRVRDPRQHVSVAVRYTGQVPDPFAAGRGVLVTVHEPSAGSATSAATFVGEANSLTTKCPSKYQAASSSY